MSSKDVINSSPATQPACLVTGIAGSNAHCSTMNTVETHENSNASNGCPGNSYSSNTNHNGNSRNSLSDRHRAALYRNIYNSSSSDDEDEHCVYTYKGAEVGSDLPEPFINLGMNSQNREGISARSSPEMDFLEMDFDPGPSNGQDSDSDNTSLYRQIPSNESFNDLSFTPENTCKIRENESDDLQLDVYDENANCYTSKSVANIEVTNGGCLDSNSAVLVQESTRESPCCSKSLRLNDIEVNESDYATKPYELFDQNFSDLSSDEELQINRNNIYNNYNIDLNDKFEADEILTDRKLSEDSDREDITFIPNGFDPSVSNEIFNENLFENLCDISLINTRMDVNNFISYDDLLPLDPSYSISAVINVMKILNNSQCVSDYREMLVSLLRSKQVAENTPMIEYLFKRSVQNANEVDLANFASVISENELHSRFFCTYPNAHFNLVEWLYSWMRKGAVPVVTRNIQERGTLVTKNIVRHPWRHNVVYKLESPYIHVSNPYEKVVDRVLHSQLSQPSVIYVKRKCILQKWHSKVDLRLLMRANHNRWYNENVLGQVTTIIRENDCDSRNTKYVRIPSNCRCGITLFVPSKNVTLCREIDEALELTTMLRY